MPSAFQLFAVSRFPAADEFGAQEQLSLLVNDENNQEPATTTVRREGSSPSPDLLQYDVTHDFLVTLEHPGRARGMRFREYVTPYKFSAFLGEGSELLGFQPLLVKTKRKVAASFISRLCGSRGDFEAGPVAVSFERLRPRLQIIRGAWFATTQPNLASTGVFGHHVDRSAEFRHAENTGELRNLMIEVEAMDLTHTVMVTAEGGLVLYHSYQSEDEEVGIVEEILRGLLAGAVAPAE